VVVLDVDTDLNRAFELYATYWYGLDTDTVLQWGAHLRQVVPAGFASADGGLALSTVAKAVFELAETEERGPKFAALLRAAKEVRTQELSAQEAARAPLPFGTDPTHPDDVFWRSVSEEDRRAALEAAVRQLAWLKRPGDSTVEPGGPITAASPFIRSLACQIARRASWRAPDALVPCGTCRGCGGRLLLDDRATRTAKCEDCRCDFILAADYRVGDRA